MTPFHGFSAVSSPEAAIDELQRLYAQAVGALRTALDVFFDTGVPPSPEVRDLFRYPELRITYAPDRVMPTVRRAFGKFQGPGVYTTTVTHPDAVRPYLLEQLQPLMHDYGATLGWERANRKSPTPMSSSAATSWAATA